MAFSKAHLFLSGDFYFSIVCKALSHPARIVILRRLLLKDKVPAGILTRGIPLSKPALSEHLRILRELHLVRCNAKGQNVIYWLNPEIPETRATLESLLEQGNGPDRGGIYGELDTLSARKLDGTKPL